MAEPGISPRQQVAVDLADTCLFGGLDESYGVNVSKGDHNGKSCWTVTFAKAAILDGVIRVYSPSFIQVKWEGKMGKGSEVFRNMSNAREFITNKFITP